MPRHPVRRAAGALLLVLGLSAATDRAPGYLETARLPDLVVILPAPPAPGSAAATADRSAFVATRSLEGSPRWRLAQADSDKSASGLAAAFACASTVALTGPATQRLLERLGRDTSAATAPAKAHWQIDRPYFDSSAPICSVRKTAATSSFDYPSGHATAGWATALVLAELVPSHATAILARGRVFGESRIVCGVHTASAVAAGMTAAAAVVAALHAAPAFAADAAAARAELAAAPRASACPPDAALPGSNSRP